MWKLKLKDFFRNHGLVMGLTIVVVSAITLGATLPFIGKDSLSDIVAFNRNSHSGSREEFEKLIEFDNTINTGDKWGKNVLEVSGASEMQSRIETNSKAIGYVSAAQVIDFVEDEEKGKQKDTAEGLILDLEDISPLDKESLLNGTYEGSRNYNMFFRQEKESMEQWGFDGASYEVPEDATHREKSAFAFYTYLLYSEEVKTVLPLASSLYADENERVSFKDEEEVDLDSLGINKAENIRFSTVGSTTVVSSLNIAFGTEDSSNSFFDVMKSRGYTITTESISVDHTGSSDAFKKSLVREAEIGFLSRDVREEESREWGYQSIEDMENTKAYSKWNTDATVIYVNTKNPYYSYEENANNITKNALELIYKTPTINWRDLEYILN